MASRTKRGPNKGSFRPVQVFSFLVQKDTYVQASIWERHVTLRDQSTFTTHEVSLRKRYKDSATGEWRSMQSFRGSELYAVEYAVQRCEAWILETRSAN